MNFFSIVSLLVLYVRIKVRLIVNQVRYLIIFLFEDVRTYGGVLKEKIFNYFTRTRGELIM